MDFSLSPFAPENLFSRDGFGSPVPRQPAHLHTQAESSLYLLRDSSRVPQRRPFIYCIYYRYDASCKHSCRSSAGRAVTPIQQYILKLFTSLSRNEGSQPKPGGYSRILKYLEPFTSSVTMEIHAHPISTYIPSNWPQFQDGHISFTTKHLNREPFLPKPPKTC